MDLHSLHPVIEPMTMEIVPTPEYVPTLRTSLRLVKHAGDRIREIDALIAEFHWSTVPAFTMLASEVGSEKVTVTRAANPLFTQWDRTHEVAFRVGEVVNALRSALDYSVFVLAWRDSGTEQRFTQFPIVPTSHAFGKREIQRRLRGMSAPHIAAIEAVQPYNDVNWLAMLAELSNQQKHKRPLQTQPSLRIQIGPNGRMLEIDHSVLALEVRQLAITCRIVDPKKSGLDPYPDVMTLFQEILVGMSAYLNPLLAEEDPEMHIEVTAHSPGSELFAK